LAAPEEKAEAQVNSQEQAKFDDMLLGYMDGLDPNSPPPSSNRTPAYHHGFMNGRDDLSRKPRDSAQNLREQADRILQEMNAPSQTYSIEGDNGTAARGAGPA
jgi:hypothetical protein